MDEPDLPVDQRIKMLMYDEADVYTVTTRYGYQTNIVFDASEEVQTISVGDRSLWQIIPSANRLFIRPMAEDVTTNMTVLTNKHSYQFDLKSLPPETSKGNIYVAKFVYPEDAPKAVAAAPAPAQPVVLVPPPPPPGMLPPPPPPPPGMMPPPPPPPQKANYNYTYTGPDELAPQQVYDDGTYTYFKWEKYPPTVPNIYVVHPDGTESMALPNIKNGLLAVETVAPKLPLKGNGGTVYIYNETLAAK
jgi:type IV secretion system protein VirB9